MPIERSWSPFP